MTLHIETPLIKSRALSLKTGRTVLLKLEGLQPSGSFKLRGVGFACEEHQRRGARRFVTASGGNAGYAVAYAGRELGIPVTVVVPQTTSERARALIRGEEAEAQSVATSLGANKVSARIVALAREHQIRNCLVTDAEAIQGSVTLLEEHRLLTEPACGASVAALARVPEYFPDARRIVVIACGGVGTTSQQLLEWSDFYRLEGNQIATSHSDEVNSPEAQQP
ncbi:pyridoxal-phosphate dependent enzyme [Paraburkholderia haematera]|uniref:L-serine ammonia-lyase n=1 Tax=Paraburkholderia haematera TaxID=2793077 RepID=A0ABN7MP49_9BURK|nr:pyridoxal-phosphate dependent enzyme [Paraburkholderia haematera]CAE6813630.1 hypothetical protein R69888_05774 [Paraburkholderia haematera]